MSESKLGMLATGEKNRDAVHVAVIPATLARRRMTPAMPVTIDRDGRCYPAAIVDAIGIIDPFLGRADLAQGTEVWILMYPNTVQNLRHDWSHPAIPDNKVLVYEEPEEEDNSCSGC